MTRFFKGIFNIRPPKPKYSFTWDVGKVLCYLGSLPTNRKLNLRLLTLKLVMLVALVTAGRCSSLIALDLLHMKKSRTTFEFAPVSQSKCSSVRRPVSSVVLALLSTRDMLQWFLGGFMPSLLGLICIFMNEGMIHFLQRVVQTVLPGTIIQSESLLLGLI